MSCKRSRKQQLRLQLSLADAVFHYRLGSRVALDKILQDSDMFWLIHSWLFMSERGIPMQSWQLQLCCWHCQAREPVLPLIRSSSQLDLETSVWTFAYVYCACFSWIWLNYCSACDATCDFWCCTMHNINRKVVLEDLALYVEAWRKMEYQHISTVSCKTELHSEGISSNDSWVPVASVRYCMAFAAHVRRRTKVECLQRSRSVFLLTGPHNSNPHSLFFVNCFYIQAGSFGILFTSLTCFTGS